MNAWVIRPREPEHANWEGDSTRQGRHETRLWRGTRGGCCSGGPDVAPIVPNGISDSNHHAYHDAEERETSYSFAPAAHFLEDDWKGSEEHVQRAVDDGHIDGDEEDDWFTEEEDPGTNQGSFEALLGGRRVLSSCRAR